MQQSTVDTYSTPSPCYAIAKQEMQQQKGIVDTYSKQSPCYGTTNTNANKIDVDDLIFDVTPFIVHLVEAVECSFSASEGSVCIAELSVSSLHEVLNRLSQCGVCASAVQCVEDSQYRLSIHTEAFTVDCKDNGNSSNSGNEGAGDSQEEEEECNESLLQSLRLLRQTVKIFSNIVCRISLHSPAELHITDICLESVDTVAKTLKTINVKPKRVFSDSSNMYCFELLREDILSSPLCLHGDDEEEDSFAGVLNCNDYFTCLRSLRADLTASLLLRQKQQQHNNDNNNNNSFCRTRGRPRKLNYSQVLVEGEPKRKRGRPRLNELYPLVASLETNVTTEEEEEGEEEGEAEYSSQSEKSSELHDVSHVS